MDEAIIRPVEGEELISAVAPLRAYAFQASPRQPDEEAWRRRLPFQAETRILAAFDGETPVATAAALPMTQNVRGAVLPMAAIGAVAVHPGVRRRGLARRLVGQLLTEGRERGQALSALYPFRESFYGRLGWVGLPQLRSARIDPRDLVPVLALELPGTVELVPMAAGFAAYRELLARVQPLVHGMALRGDLAAGAEAEADRWLALARDGSGTVVGALRYEIRRWQGDLYADAFVTATATARYQLLQWLAHHADQATTAELLLPPDSLPELWLADLTATVSTRPDFVTPMGRVLDVAALTGIPCGTGTATVAVTDPLCRWNEGTYTLSERDGTLVVALTAPGVPTRTTLTIQAVSALVLGGYDPAEFPLRGWATNLDPATADALRTLFPRPATLPYLYEEF